MENSAVYREVIRCRLCGHDKFAPVTNLGEHYITNYVAPDKIPESPLKSPLELVQCVSCELVQLRHTVRPEILYKGEQAAGYYWYQTSIGQTTLQAAHEAMDLAQEAAQVQPGDIVLDIGVNDGGEMETVKPGVLRVGFEPGPNLAPKARARGVYVINELFDSRLYHQVFKKKPKLVTAIAMFYDIDAPLKFLRQVANLLADDGVLLIQMNDLWSLVQNGTYDIIGSEHLIIWSLAPFMKALQWTGLQIYKLEHIPLNGGTLRALIAHSGARPVEPSVYKQLAIEHNDLNAKAIAGFAQRVEKSSEALRDFVLHERASGGRVYSISASTRGNTLLQASGLDSSLIDGAAEIHPDKLGKVLVGTNIPIVSEAEAKSKATAFIVLPYSYPGWEQRFPGYKLFYPLPEPRLVQA